MYCVKCGTELENEEICPSCGQLREDQKEKYVRNTLISGKGLYRSYRGIIIKLLVILYAITLIAPWVINGQIYQVEIYRGIARVTSVLYALSVFFALWRILAKAGMHGWAMLIPFYNVYCVFKLAFYEAFQTLLIYISVAFLGTFLTYFGGASGPWILAIFVVFWIMLYIKLLYRISVNFGHGAGYTVGLIFMPYLFILLLGWGNDDYILDRDAYYGEIDPQELRFRPHKKHKKWLFILVALIILGVGGMLYVISLPEFTGTGNADGLSLQVNQSISHIMKINYQNNAPNKFSLGWDQMAKVVAITDKGEYTGTIFGAAGFNTKLKPGERGFFVAIFRDIKGNIKQLNFEGILYLGDDGLPEQMIDYSIRKIFDREAQIQIPIVYKP